MTFITVSLSSQNGTNSILFSDNQRIDFDENCKWLVTNAFHAAALLLLTVTDAEILSFTDSGLAS